MKDQQTLFGDKIVSLKKLHNSYLNKFQDEKDRANLIHGLKNLKHKVAQMEYENQDLNIAIKNLKEESNLQEVRESIPTQKISEVLQEWR